MHRNTECDRDSTDIILLGVSRLFTPRDYRAFIHQQQTMRHREMADYGSDIPMLPSNKINVAFTLRSCCSYSMRHHGTIQATRIHCSGYMYSLYFLMRGRVYFYIIFRKKKWRSYLSCKSRAKISLNSQNS